MISVAHAFTRSGGQKGETNMLTPVNYCQRCGKNQVCEIYLGSGNYLHSLCSGCGRDVSSQVEVREIISGMILPCKAEGRLRRHIRYLSRKGNIHYFCCTCGRDVSIRDIGDEAQRKAMLLAG
jgi:hypothetical protein